MSKSVKIVRTFPNSWYKFIVEGDATGLSDSERMIAESALQKAFPDGGDIIAAKMGTKKQKYSTLVCESYSISGCPEKTEGKTFKVKVEADSVKNPKTYEQYVGEDIETLRKRRAKAPDYNELKKKDSETSKNGQETPVQGTNAEGDISLVGRVAGYDPSRFDVTARVYDEWKDVFGTEINKDENAGKSEDGSDTITQERAARQLRDEITKAYEADDKDRLKELRPLLPLIAWYSSNYNRNFTTLFKSMTQQGQQLKTSAYHKLVEVLPAVYDVAFGLDESDETREAIKKYIGGVDNFGDIGATQTDPEERRAYAKEVFDRVIFGRTISEKCAGEVTQSVASTQQTNFSRMERSEFNRYYKPFIEWFEANKDDFDMAGYIKSNWTKMEPYEFNYARGVYLIDSVRDMVTDIEEDVKEISNNTALTQKGLTSAYTRMVTFGDGESAGGEKLDSRKMKCFNGLLVETWKKLGISVGTKSVTGQAGNRKDAEGKATKSKRTVTVLGDFNGTMDEFKEAFHTICEEAKTKLESMLVSLNNEYDEFKDKYDEKMQNLVNDLKSGNTKDLKANRSPVPTFNLNDESKVLGKGTPGRQWIKQFTTSRMNDLVFKDSLNEFRSRQTSGQGQHVMEIGMTPLQQSRVTGGGEELLASGGEAGKGDMASTEDQREQDAIGSGDDDDGGEGEVSSSPDIYKDREYIDIKFKKLNEKLIGEDDEELTKRATDLNIKPERAKKIVEDWKKICDAPGGIGEVMGIAQTKGGKSKDTKDADAEKYRNAADKLIKAEEEKRDADYQAAKDALEYAKDGGNKDEIKEAKAELENAKKARKLSSKEKAEIVRKVRYADVGKGIEVQGSWDDLVGKRGALAQGVRKLGGSAVLSLIRHFGYMFAPNGTDEDTYKGLPDLLVLLLHDQIMECHKNDPDESLETCIDRVSRAARPEFITFTTDISQVHKYVADTMKNESEGDDDKFLASMEQMLDLIENSDLDAQAKLDMVEALELSFALWCEKNEVVPEEVNPEEDKDAIENHPEDEE